MDDETYEFTEKGLFIAMEMHQKLLDGWTIEQVADFHDLTATAVQIVLAGYYQICEQNSVDLGIYVPDYLPDDLEN